MKRITAIELHNFLAFYGTDNKISLPKGENLLLYGENGSGKSSLCRALEVFFEARNNPQFEVHQRNIWATPTDAPTDLRVTFDKFLRPTTAISSSARPSVHPAPPPIPTVTPNAPPPFPDPPQTLDVKTASGTAWIEESRLASGFLTYRDILKTHFIEEHRQNLFDLVVNEILRGYKDKDTGVIFDQAWRDYRAEVKEHIIKDWGDPMAREMTEDGEEVSMMEIRDRNWNDLMDKGDTLEEVFSEIMNTLDAQVNIFLKEFDPNISVQLSVEDDPNPKSVFQWEDDPDIDVDEIISTPILTVKVTFFKKIIPEHQTFLNEARLSALAICIFLAALRLKPDPKNGCKVLFLDDVLIGLDSGNRLPLFQILERHFTDFQIFLSTYDRHWFELSKDGLPKEEWLSAELYAKTEFDAADKPLREVPKLFSGKGNLELAKAYFEQFDYPAAGNALRKECEKILKNYMERIYLLNNNGNLLALGDLLLKLTEYFEDAGQTIPRDVLSQIIFFKNALFNPASHYDLRSSFYRREIEKAFEAIKKLGELPKISWSPILYPCQEFEFENVATNFKAKILVGDYVYKTKFDGYEGISKIRFYLDWWEKDGVEFWNRKTNARRTDKEIAGISTKPHSLEDVSNWLVQMTGTPIPDVKTELKFSGDALDKILM